MIKLVIFDLDGTIANTIEDLADSADRALEENGFPPHTLAEYKHFVGNGVKKLIERAVPDGTDEEETKRIFDRFSLIYQNNCLNKTRPYDGICELIDELKEAGIRCAVASNKPDEFSKRIVSHLFKENSFDIVIGKREGIPPKPDPMIIKEILEKLSTAADEAVIAGDSDVDVYTAHNAGIRCIGCEWGFRGREELEKAGADAVAVTPSQIYSIVKMINNNMEDTVK